MRDRATHREGFRHDIKALLVDFFQFLLRFQLRNILKPKIINDMTPMRRVERKQSNAHSNVHTRLQDKEQRMNIQRQRCLVSQRERR